MNLIIDIGNTYTKAGIFDNGRLIDHSIIHNPEEDLNDFLNGKPIKRGIISSVGKSESFDFQFPVLYLDSHTAMPFQNQYKTKATLGKDRLALAAAAYYKYPGQDCLIIDAGTCITYDLLDSSGNYLGGGISPGLEMRLKALNQFTARLPKVAYSKDYDLIGDSTKSSILSGTVGGFLKEVEGTIAAYQNRYPSVINIITGGDAYIFEDLSKNSIFAPPEFLLSGLNHILEYNAEKL